MKRIITIDFDVIMSPSITLYNDMIGPQQWEQTFMNDPQLALSRGDYARYAQLTAWLMIIAKELQPSAIHFIHSHDHIMKYIPKDNEELTIVNIDHHHDISYNDKDSNEMIEVLTCGNWIKYISENRKLARYIWINNSNSTPPHEATKNLISMNCLLQNYNLNNLTAPDVLVLCLSDEWVPPPIRPLFFLWMHLLGEYYDCNFEFED